MLGFAAAVAGTVALWPAFDPADTLDAAARATRESAPGAVERASTRPRPELAAALETRPAGVFTNLTRRSLTPVRSEPQARLQTWHRFD